MSYEDNDMTVTVDIHNIATVEADPRPATADRYYSQWRRHIAREYAAILRRSDGTGVIPLVTSDLAALRPHWDNLQEWTVAILGPAGTPYSDGILAARLTLAHDHPFEPPSVTFVGRVYHPNIHHRSGACWADLFVRGGQADNKTGWQPMYTLEGIVTQLAALLTEPTFNIGCWHDPKGVDALMVSQVQLGLYDRETWEKEAAKWTREYARPAHCADDAGDLIVIGANLAGSLGKEGHALLEVWCALIIGPVLRHNSMATAVQEDREDARDMVRASTATWPNPRLRGLPSQGYVCEATIEERVRLEAHRMHRQEELRLGRLRLARLRWHPCDGLWLKPHRIEETAPACATCRLTVYLAFWEYTGDGVHKEEIECVFCEERALSDEWRPVVRTVKRGTGAPLCLGERIRLIWREGPLLNITSTRCFEVLPHNELNGNQ